MGKRIKVLIVDDHLMVRKGLALLVSGFKDMQLVGEAPNAAAAVKLFESERPDVTLVDMMLPDMSGIEIIRRVRKNYSDAVFIALTSFGDEKLIKESLSAGARGFLYKDVSVKDLADAIRQTHKGRVILDKKASDAIMRLVGDSVPVASAYPELSEREKNVLHLLTQGLTNKQIAIKMKVQLSTVKQYVSNIFSKLKVKSRTEATAAALRLGLIEE